MNGHMSLRVSYQGGSVDQWLTAADEVLAVFEFGRSPLESSDPRHVPVALPQLDSPSLVEVWRCDGPIKSGTWDLLRFAQGDPRPPARPTLRAAYRHRPGPAEQHAGRQPACL